MNPMDQEEMFCDEDPDMKPGWIYDRKTRKISAKTFVSKKSPILWSNLSLKHKDIEEMTLENDLIYENDFKNAEEKHCFVMVFTGSYSDTLNSFDNVTEGTVTEVNYRKTIRILVCSTSENSHDACCSYMENVLKGSEAELDSETCFSCKKCYVYDLSVGSKCKKQSFDYIIYCLNEVSRIVKEIKAYENLRIFTWKYSKITINKQVNNLSQLPPARTRDPPTSCEDQLLKANESNSSEIDYSPVCHNLRDCNTSCCSREVPPVHIGWIYSGSAPPSSKGDAGLPSTSTETENLNNKTCVHRPSSHSQISCNSMNEINKESSNHSRKMYEAQSATTIDTGKSTLSYDSENATAVKVPSTLMNNSAELQTVISMSPECLESDKELVKTDENVVYSKNVTIGEERSSYACDSDNELSNKAVFKNEICSENPLASDEWHSNGPMGCKAITMTVNNIFEEKNVSYIGTGNDNLDPDVKGKEKENLKSKKITVAERLLSNGPPNSNSEELKRKKQIIDEKYINYSCKKISITVSELDGIRKVSIGKKISEEKGKVIVLLGATGSGKTTLINLCANYYFGAQSAEEEKLFIVESKGKTDRVTVYTFHPEGENQIPLTVIDTPGLNDSTGAEIHDHVDALKSFLALACSQGLEINALGFVAQAHLVRLTSSEKLVMDYVKSLFGAEVETHIMALVTFADNQPTPPVVEAMEQYGFQTPFFVKFNNTLLISKSEEVDELDQIYWRTGIRSWKKCLKRLNMTNTLSNAAILSVKSDVFNNSILNKFRVNLQAEIRSFIAMCFKESDLNGLYRNEKLRQQRTQVWLLSNDAYNMEIDDLDVSKDLFLIKAFQHQLSDKDSRFSDILLYLLLDNESSMRRAIMLSIDSLLKCNKIFYSIKIKSNNVEKSVLAHCVQCEKNCNYKRSYYGSTRFRCTCDCRSGVHISPPDCDDLNVIIPDRKQFYELAAQMIKKELLKCMEFASVKWTVEQIFMSLNLNEPHHMRRDISAVSKGLIRLILL